MSSGRKAEYPGQSSIGHGRSLARPHLPCSAPTAPHEAFRILVAHDCKSCRIRFAAGVVAVLPSLVYFLVLVSIGVESLQLPAGAMRATSALYSILASPLLETALMLPVAFLLKRLIPSKERVRIVLLAAIFAFAHKFGGGWRQVIASSWPFLIYSVTLTTWLKRSGREAFVVTALVHALYNATFFGIGALGALMASGEG